MVKLWLGLGTKMTWLTLGKDYIWLVLGKISLGSNKSSQKFKKTL